MQIHSFADDCDQYVNRNSDPDLGFYRIFSSTVKLFDPQVLLYPFKKQLNMPTVFVQFCDGQCRQIGIVGEKYQSLVPASVVVFDAP